MRGFSLPIPDIDDQGETKHFHGRKEVLDDYVLNCTLFGF